ncbi:hypothetical protein [Marinobacter nauticus]|uniref:hypothetical protein n=1 Tax=Marinobacter nauticus TaxID=2743 RepID=UPI001C99B8F8|nr:hypothetical protein [Marinobacter nauticus]MBY5961928.1 hypothetical protein [Marinobacter nauticus]
MSDLLKMDHINSLPQPFIAKLLGGDEWEVLFLCVETGCMTINACGFSQPTHIDEVNYFIDSEGNKHEPDTFYTDSEASHA